MNDIAITIKPTLACNMYCKHCFNGEYMNNLERLPLETALKVIELASDEYSNVKVTFHGGEPTMMGYTFYSDFYEFQHKTKNEKQTKFSNYFTTNGLLLDEKFIELLGKNNVLINISFDGPFNDVLRYDTEKVYENIMKVKELGVALRIFCTLTAASITKLKYTYEWFNERNLDFKIAPLEPWGYATKHPDLLLDPDEYLDNLFDAYMYWIYDVSCNIKFNTFEEFITLDSTQQFKPSWFNKEIALNPDGYLYPFGRPNDMKYCLGSPYNISKISECFECEQYNNLMTKLKKARAQRCLKCDSFASCNGVVQNNTYMYVDDTKLLDNRCYIADQIFKRASMINSGVMKQIRNGKCGGFNPRVIKYFMELK